MKPKTSAIIRFLRDTRGSAAPLEFVLISIPMILVVLTVVQLMLLAHGSVVMKQAAYAAARAALVHSCPPFNLKTASGSLFGAVKEVWGGCTDTQEQKDMYERAARIALIPISSSSGQANARADCQYPEALIKMMHEGAGTSTSRTNLEKAIRNKACYAFEEANVKVEVEWQSLAGFTYVDTRPPIKAKVTFRMPVLPLIPAPRIFGAEKRASDSTYYWVREAEAMIL